MNAYQTVARLRNVVGLASDVVIEPHIILPKHYKIGIMLLPYLSVWKLSNHVRRYAPGTADELKDSHDRPLRGALLAWHGYGILVADLNIYVAQSAHAEQKERDLVAKLDDAASRLTEADHLVDVLRTMQNELALRVDRWAKAIGDLRSGEDDLARLMNISIGLPARDAEIAEMTKLMQDLSNLEEAEADGAEMDRVERERQTMCDDYDIKLNEYDRDKVLLCEMAATLKEREGLLTTAKATAEARRAKVQRCARIDLFTELIAGYEDSCRLIQQVERNLGSAEQSAAMRDHWKQRVATLEELTNVVQDRNVNEQSRRSVRARHEALSERLSERASMQREFDTQAAEARFLEAEMTCLETALGSATDRVRDARHREELDGWRVARADHKSAEPILAKFNDLQWKHEKQQNSIAASEEQASALRRQIMPVYIAIGASAIAISIALILHVFLIVALAIPVMCIACIGALKSSAKSRETAETLDEARSALARIEGEMGALETQIEHATLAVDSAQARVASAEDQLVSLGFSIPDSDQEAAARLAVIPTTSLSTAATARDQAHLAVKTAELKLANLSRSLQTLGEQVAGNNVASIKAKLADLAREDAELTDKIAVYDNIDIMVVDAGVLQGLPALPAALSDARESFALSKAAVETVKQLAADLLLLRDSESRKLEEMAGMAAELGLQSVALEDLRLESAHELQALVEERKSVSDEGLATAVEEAQIAVNGLTNQLAVLTDQQSQRRRTLASSDRVQLAEQLAEIRGNLAMNADQIRSLSGTRDILHSHNLPSTWQSLSSLVGARRHQLETDRERTSEIPNVHQLVLNQSISVEVRSHELTEAWQSTFTDLAVPGNPDAALALLAERAEACRDMLSNIPVETLTEKSDRLKDELDDVKRLLGGIRRDIQTLEAAINESLTVFKVGSVLDIKGAFPRLSGIEHTSIEHWEDKLAKATECRHSNRSQRKVLADGVGIGDEAVDVACARAEHDEQALDNAAKDRMCKMVEETRKSIVSRIMPLTQQITNMLLPLLTNARYREVRWDEVSNVLSVYDERARDFQRKRVFSGGTRDQISLALRLAFALATLPGENESRPGFLFLDEPLSSFDKTRTLDLVHLMTQGIISKRFDQIFLISHSETFDPTLFKFRIRMANGTVQESNLPRAGTVLPSGSTVNYAHSDVVAGRR